MATLSHIIQHRQLRSQIHVFRRIVIRIERIQNYSSQPRPVVCVRQSSSPLLLRGPLHYHAFISPKLPRISSAASFSSAANAIAPTLSSVPSSEPLPSSYLPIDLKTAAKIDGEESHIAIVQLQPGECLRAESGAMIFMTSSIEMNTHLAGASNAFSRMLTGQNVFLTDFTCHKVPGTVALGTDFPSKILRVSLDELPNHSLICQRGAYLASNPTVEIRMEFTKSMTAGFFGGQGFVLQKLVAADDSTADNNNDNNSDVLIKAGGTVVVKDLRENETLRVSSGSIVAFESTVEYDVQMMKGIKNVMFGGEGLFVTKLTGPGRVWLQGMPPDRMIAEIARRVPGKGIGFVPFGMGGGGGGDSSNEDEATNADGGGEDMVAASDADTQADRQATVASSGMDSTGGDTADADSPSALFGDAAASPLSSGSSAASDDNDFTHTSSSSTTEPSFQDDSFSNEPTFDDTSMSSADSFGQDDKFFNDTTSTDIGDGSNGGETQSSGFFGMLWDMFMGNDDEE